MKHIYSDSPKVLWFSQIVLRVGCIIIVCVLVHPTRPKVTVNRVCGLPVTSSVVLNTRPEQRASTQCDRRDLCKRVTCQRLAWEQTPARVQPLWRVALAASDITRLPLRARHTRVGRSEATPLTAPARTDSKETTTATKARGGPDDTISLSRRYPQRRAPKALTNLLCTGRCPSARSCAHQLRWYRSPT